MPTKIEKDIVSGRDTTGHEWDGLKELNTPLPKWWLYVLYATIVWAAVLFVLYPSMPGVNGYFHGVLGYSQRAAVERRCARGDGAARRHDGPDQGVCRSPRSARIRSLMAAAATAGRIAFANNCQPCHGAGGGGGRAIRRSRPAPGSGAARSTTIQQTITYGIRSGDPEAREAQMPRFGADGILKPAEVQQVADYVMTLFGDTEPGKDVSAGTEDLRRELRDLPWRGRAGGSREGRAAAGIARASLWQRPRHRRRAGHRAAAWA